MEQLKQTILEFDAFALGGDKDVAPFVLKVFSPEHDERRGFFCRVICPYLREKPYLIFGADEAQACELSIDFIRQMLEGQAELVDADGAPVELPEIVWNE